MGSYCNGRHIKIFHFFLVLLLFFSFVQTCSHFYLCPDHYFFLSSLPYCCIFILSYLYPASPIQHRLPVGSEDLSFRDLLFCPDKLAVKVSSLWITLCINLNLIDPFYQRAFISIMCLFFSHLSHLLPLHVLLQSQASACCTEVSWLWTSSSVGRGITVS